jgi:hypothetical protein
VARIAAIVPDLMFASRIDATLGAAGHEVKVLPSVEALEGDGGEPELVIVDLAELDPEPFAGRAEPVLAFYAHTDVELRRRAEAAGFDLVVPRSRMAREMPQLVDSLLG